MVSIHIEGDTLAVVVYKIMYEYQARLVRIIDGDTVDCDIDLGFDVWIRERVRLAGIDAPEVRTRDLEEKKAGKEATQWLQVQFETYAPDNLFKLITNDFNRTGKYGRTIGTIYINETNINEQMIKEGHAKIYQ